MLTNLNRFFKRPLIAALSCLLLCVNLAPRMASAANTNDFYNRFPRHQTISAGYYRSAIITKDGSLYMSGRNITTDKGIYSEYGHFKPSYFGEAYEEYRDSNVFVKIMDDVTDVDCAEITTAVIKTDGSVWVCGTETDLSYRNAFIKIFDGGARFVSVYHEQYIMVIDNNDDLWISAPHRDWDAKEVPDMTVTIKMIGQNAEVRSIAEVYLFDERIDDYFEFHKAMSDVKSLTICRNHAIFAATKNDGSIQTWNIGDTYYEDVVWYSDIYDGVVRQYGTREENCPFISYNEEVSAKLDAMSGIADVSSGVPGASWTSFLVLKTNGDVIAFGRDNFGQLGDGSNYQIETPKRVFAGARLPYEKTATPSSKPLNVAGVEMDISRYEIAGELYVKLRSLAFKLKGTSKEFNIGWADKNGAVTLRYGKYVEVGGEDRQNPRKVEAALPSIVTVSLNGKSYELPVCSIRGENYYRLSDIAEMFGF